MASAAPLAPVPGDQAESTLTESRLEQDSGDPQRAPSGYVSFDSQFLTSARSSCIETPEQEEEADRRHRRNVLVCMWISYWSTVTTQMVAGAFLDIYLYKVSGSNATVGAIESARGIAQLLAAPMIGIVADRYDRRRLSVIHAALRVLPLALLCYAVAQDRHRLVFIALPALAVSNHLGLTLRGAMLADNLPEGPMRIRGLSRNFSATYLGQATGPLLQLAVMLACDLHGTWSLQQLRVTILAGAAAFLLAEPAALLMLPAEPLPSDPRPAARCADMEVLRIEKAWKEERVLRCCRRGGYRKMWAVPILVELTFLVCIFGSGLTVKFFPLYFASAFGFSPVALCALGVAEPLGVALLTQGNGRITKRLGRAPAALMYMLVAPVMLLAVSLGTSAWYVAPCFVLRTATARAYIPIYQSIVATCVPVRHRGKFAALSGFRMSFFSASAFAGGWLADFYGSYRPAFLVTAAWQVVPCCLLFLPVVFWMPRSGADS